MQDTTANLDQLKQIVQEFVKQRDWIEFHTPKNMAIALSVEAGELLEKFIWLNEKQSFDEVNKNRQEIEHEVADIFIALLEFCNVSKIDLTKAMFVKLQEIEKKYPVEKCKGISDKYNKL